jgi:hypothetical protein
MALPLKIDTLFSTTSEPAGRLEAWGVPGALADRVRQWLGREVVPTEPGAEWPHGRMLLPQDAQDRMEDWARELENAWTIERDSVEA